MHSENCPCKLCNPKGREVRIFIGDTEITGSVESINEPLNVSTASDIDGDTIREWIDAVSVGDISLRGIFITRQEKLRQSKLRYLNWLFEHWRRGSPGIRIYSVDYFGSE